MKITPQSKNQFWWTLAKNKKISYVFERVINII